MSQTRELLKPIETSALLLRPFRMSDLNDFYEYAKRPEIGPNAGWRPHPNKVHSAKILRSFLKAGDVYAIVLKEEAKVIGSIGLHENPVPEPFAKDYPGQRLREVGYVLSSDYWNKGYMTQALSAVIYYACQTLKLDGLFISHNEENIRSKRVIEKCGFHLVGSYQKELVFLDGRIVTSRFYTLFFDHNWKPASDPQYDEISIW